MDAKKRKSRVGHGIDKMPHQMLTFAPDLIVLATEWHDALSPLRACHLTHAVALQPGAVDQEVAFHRIVARFDPPRLPAPLDARDLKPEPDFATQLDDLSPQRFAYPSVIDDPLLRHEHGGQPGCMRFPLAKLLRAQPSKITQAVRRAALHQRLQPGDFLF